MPKRSKPKKFNWRDLPDPITTDEINIELSRTTDPRTTTALERQARKIGFDSANDTSVRWSSRAWSTTNMIPL